MNDDTDQFVFNLLNSNEYRLSLIERLQAGTADKAVVDLLQYHARGEGETAMYARAILTTVNFRWI